MAQRRGQDGLPGGVGGAAPIRNVADLARRLSEFVTPTTAIVCVGSELRGDDAAGVEIARRLIGTVPWRVFNTQTAPESFLMKIVEGRPQSLVLVDALDFGAPGGAVALLEADGIEGQSPSTHGPAPSAFLRIVQMMHQCPCFVLGIQPAGLKAGEPLSEAVAAAVEMVVAAFGILAGRGGE
jgi:hydrogenase maturation protease